MNVFFSFSLAYRPEHSMNPKTGFGLAKTENPLLDKGTRFCNPYLRQHRCNTWYQHGASGRKLAYWKWRRQA